MSDRDTGVKETNWLVHKNCMRLIASVYGVELEEAFYLYGPSGKTHKLCKLCESGLWSYENNRFGLSYWHDISFVINELVTGKLAVQKMTTEDTVKDFMEKMEIP